MGLGQSGLAAAHFLAQQGAQVIVNDQKTKEELMPVIQSLTEFQIKYELGENQLDTLENVDLIVVSPGIPLHHPFLKKATSQGIPLTNEMEIALTMIQKPVIAITGTNGKSTTASLIAEILRAAGNSVFLGGNIGNPLLNYLIEKKDCDWIVAEISSFQLELIHSLVPAVAVITNVASDHLEHHLNLEAYIEAKRRMVKFCHQDSYLVLNYDDPVVRGFRNETQAKVMGFMHFSQKNFVERFPLDFYGACITDQTREILLQIKGEKEVYSLKGFQFLGAHNRENFAAALCAVRAMGVSPEVIQSLVKTLHPIPHRLEFVRRKNQVYFFNDSKSTNIHSLRKSLESFSSHSMILIAGGKDKNEDFSELVELVKKKCKMLILIGEAKERMNRALGDYVETYLVGGFKEAVYLAYQKSRNQDIILLSPGCSSYDMFKNFEERGQYFKELVAQL